MFTGLIEQVGRLEDIRPDAEGARLTVRAEPWSSPLQPGESVAVQGACLTVAKVQGERFTCDVLRETLSRTTLGGLRSGARLNLERALRADGRFGGHLVTGHVDGVGRVVTTRSIGRDWEIDLACSGDLMQGVVRKGSVALDGVSLTVVGMRADGFTVCIIPFTWQNTSLSGLAAGNAVNIETDLIGKYVFRLLGHAGLAPSPLTLDTLHAAGFGSVPE
jgi:riboflavin synthase